MNSPPSNKSLTLSLLLPAFLLLGGVLAAFIYLASHWATLNQRIDSNFLSLLPKAQQNPYVEEVIQKIARTNEDIIVVLVGHQDVQRAIYAADLLKQKMVGLPVSLKNNVPTFFRADNERDQHAYLTPPSAAPLAFYAAYQNNLLTNTDLQLFNQVLAHPHAHSNPALLERSYAKAYSMMGIGSGWKEDPFGFFENWLLNLGQFSKVRPLAEHLVVSDKDKKYIFLTYQTKAHAFSTQWLEKFNQDLNRIVAEVKQQAPEIVILKAGISLHAAAATQQAHQESLLIGVLSALGGALLIGLAFRKWYALPLVIVTVLLSFTLALTATTLLFQKIYLLTIVFGTTLIGMSIDYCLYWLSSSIKPTPPPLLRRSTLLPGMALALITTACGYLLLAATPFPVFTQMALFSLAGVISAWLIVMLWFPLFTRLQFKENRFIHLFAKIKLGLTSKQSNRRYVLILLISGATYGIFSVNTNDDVRQLITPDKNLLSEQIALQAILDQPSPAQFYLVTGYSPEEVLQHAETLTSELDKVVQEGTLKGYQSITQWLPSVARQHHIIDLRRSEAYQEMIIEIKRTLGLNNNWKASSRDNILTFEQWQQAPFAPALNFMWFQLADGRYATTILLRGIQDKAALPALSKLANETVLWVDKPTEISHLFENYRKRFTWVVCLAYVLTFALLLLRYGRQAWRAVLPPLLGSALVMTIFSLSGESIGLLSILALALVLGVGTDYGIFILEYPRNPRMVLSISIGACMTIITFGSLALSAIPALHNFGLTVCLGVALSWLLTLFFATPRPEKISTP